MGIFGAPVPGNSAARRHGSYTSEASDVRAEATVSSEYERSDATRNWDAALDFVESDPVNYGMTAGAIGVAAIFGGAAAAAPVALGAAAGMAGGFVGAEAGGWLGAQVMPALGFKRMPQMGEMPATLGHPIAHPTTPAALGALVAGALAAVAVGAAIAATGGAALLVIAAAGFAAGAVAGLGAGFASVAGQYGENMGLIIQGSTNVFFHGKPIARLTDKVQCSCHDKQAIAEGVETVFANKKPIARIGHKTTCAGFINAGCPSIAVDKATGMKMRLDIDGGMAERWTRTGLALLNFLPIPRGKKGRNKADLDPPTKTEASVAHGAPNSCRTCGKDPVDLATGQLMDLRTDLFVPGTLPMQLTRSYRPNATGIQGKGWAGSWAQHLKIEGDTLVYQDPDGVLITFHTPYQALDAENTRFAHLNLLGDKTGEIFLYNRREQLFYVFDHRVKDRILLSKIEDRNGNALRFSYDQDGLARVSHSDGFALAVLSSGWLIRSAKLLDHDDDDCVFEWAYTEDGRLCEVRSSQTGTLSYRYDSMGRLTRWADSKSTEVFYAYDDSGRICRTWTTSGHMGGRFTYDDALGITTLHGDEGAVSQYHHRPDGVVWKEVDAKGAVWLTDWDDRFNVISRTDPLDNQVTFSYTPDGNLASAKDPDGDEVSWSYTEDGQLAATTDPSGATRSFAYDANGNLIAMTDAAGDITSLRLGQKGEVLRVDLPGDLQERIDYDALMRPCAYHTATGRVQRVTHDTEGRLRQVQDASGAYVEIDRTRGPDNPRGEVRRVLYPDGTTIQQTWDCEGQLASMTNIEGHKNTYSFGAFDLPITSTDAQGHTMALEHDSELRLTAVINEAGERYSYTYDLTGALIAETDFSGLQTTYTRDLAGRLIRKTAPDGVETSYDYSPRGDLIKMTVAEGEALSVTTYEYDARRLLIATENAEARVEYDYDVYGRVVLERVNGREIRSTYGPGAEGRITREGDVLALANRYSKSGQLEELQIGPHAPLKFERNAYGFEVLRHSAQGFGLAQSHTPGGLVKAQATGPREHLPDEAKRGVLHDQLTGAGIRAHRQYDWDRLGRARQIHDSHWGQSAFDYDPRGQVTRLSQKDRRGGEQHKVFDYDPTQNITYIETGQKHHEVVKQDPGGRVRQRGKTFYRYDACGRVIEKRIEEPGFRPKVWTMGWDGQNQLTRVETPDGATWSYGYDPLGRRVRRICETAGQNSGPWSSGEGRAYQWDGDQIVAEAPILADGTVAWDQAEAWIYEPDTFCPLAKVVGDELYYAVTDHMGTPRELLSEDGKTIVWRAKFGLWGELENTTSSAPTSCPIRFQGQWHDEETGLHYNRFRYYDPGSTQYLSPDPIGLNGGTRPQSYVNNPNQYIDPLGLAKCPRGGAYFTQKDNLAYQYSLRRPDANPVGYFDVMLHATKDSIDIPSAHGNYTVTDHRALANLIRRSEGYKKGQSVRLLSCELGKNRPNNPPLAQGVANKLGAAVIAPDESWWIRSDGSHYVAENLYDLVGDKYVAVPGQPGSWRLFIPGN